MKFCNIDLIVWFRTIMKVSPLLKSCFVVQCLMWTANSQSQHGIIETSSGWIKGSSLSVNGHRVYQYLGIPYAQPPLGDLRFRKPQPIQPWSGTLKAKRMPPACIQHAEYPFPWYDFQHGKSEDCLYLNMWVPETKHENCNKKKKSVMFWIHGGGFAFGSIRKPVYNGRALAAEGDVIVVTINYRLGAFGFFTTNTDAAPVNVALYDMLEALKWVHKNIEEFGGDPNQVTVFGESAGSWAAGLFCVSPLTKGLFHRVIMESGSHAYIPFDDNTTSLETSQKLAETLGCADPLKNIFTSPDKVADCMRTKDAFDIAKTLTSFNPKAGAIYNAVYGNEFLPDNAREALKLGKFHNVSVLIGNNRDEGSVFLTTLLPEVFGFFGKQRSKLNTSMAENILKSVFKDKVKGIPATEVVTQTILGSLSTKNYRKNLRIIYDFVGDFKLLCPTVYFAESYSRYGKDVYFYFFNHRPSTTPWAKWMGVAHYEEVQFVFGSPVKKNKYTDEEVELSKLMMKMWSNFAKYGDPFHNESNQSNSRGAGLLQKGRKLEKWPKYSRETPLYLKLDRTTRKAKRYNLGPHKDNCDLLREIHGFP